MELFLSYRRTNWPFAHQLANDLRKFIDATIFVDYQSVDETDFEVSILSHLRKCDVVLLIVSKDTFDASRIHRDDDWVRREIREALLRNKPIVVVFVDIQTIPADIPHDIRNIRRMEGVNFYPEYVDAASKRLVEFILKATPLHLMLLDEEEEETQDALPSLEDAIKAINLRDYDRALLMLEKLARSGFKSEFVTIADIIEDAKRQRDLECRLQEASAAYRVITVLAGSKVTLERARIAWKAFRIAYPEFDDDTSHLAEKLSLSNQPVKGIDEIIASGSNRNPANLSLDDVLSYFANTPVDAPPATIRPMSARPRTPPESASRV